MSINPAILGPSGGYVYVDSGDGRPPNEWRSTRVSPTDLLPRLKRIADIIETAPGVARDDLRALIEQMEAAGGDPR